MSGENENKKFVVINDGIEWWIFHHFKRSIIFKPWQIFFFAVALSLFTIHPIRFHCLTYPFPFSLVIWDYCCHEKKNSSFFSSMFFQQAINNCWLLMRKKNFGTREEWWEKKLEIKEFEMGKPLNAENIFACLTLRQLTGFVSSFFLLSCY